MAKKEPKFPNKVFGGDPIVIPSENISVGGTKYGIVDKKISFTASAPLSKEFIDDLFNSVMKPIEYVEEKTPVNYKNPEIERLRYISQQLLKDPYSVSNIVRLFSNSKFPKNVRIQCNKCMNHTALYIVDFYTHCIIDHGNSLQHTVDVFNRVLDKIQTIE